MNKNEQDKFTLSHTEAFLNSGKDESKLESVLEEYGIAIITEVLNEASRNDLEKYFFLDDLANTVDSSSNDVSFTIDSWKRKGIIPDPISKKDGLMATRGLPQGKFAWQCRLNPKVKELFACIYKDKSLASGLDCPFFSPLDDDTKETTDRYKEWLHVDQNYHTGITHKCFQGLLYVWGSEDPNSSTTVVWPKSHKTIYNELMADSFVKASPWHSVNLNQIGNKCIYQAAIDGAKRLCVPPGSLLLWDSRLIHQGWRSGPRLAMPVCWEPKARRHQSALDRKLWMCATGLPSSHSSSEGRVHCVIASDGRPKCYKPTENDDPSHLFRLPLLPILTPWCIRPECIEDWYAIQSNLWRNEDTAYQNANSISEEEIERIRGMLRKEVLAVI